MVQGRKQIKVSGRSSYPSKNISVKKNVLAGDPGLHFISNS